MVSFAHASKSCRKVKASAPVEPVPAGSDYESLLIMKVYIFEVGHFYDAANVCNVYLFKRSALRAARRYMRAHAADSLPSWCEPGWKAAEREVGARDFYWERSDGGYAEVYSEPLRLLSRTSIADPP